MSRYGFSHAERATSPVVVLCRVLRVARSADYAWARRGDSARAQSDALLAERIAAAHARSRGTYGTPRIQAVLRAAGVRTSRRRVARLMRQAGLVGCHRRRRVRTTVVEPTRAPAPNLVARNFTAPCPDRLWVGDITYIATAAGWLYLAVLLDVHARRVVGWAMADHLRTELPLDAPTMALRSRRPTPGLVHHTDRGCQYTAAAYQTRLASASLVCSMSRAGECLDNAMAERFFATLKAELVDTHRWQTRAAARTAIFERIEVFYNRQRCHSALAYRPPAAFEAALLFLSNHAA